jgi:hypothetical protein
MHDPLLPIRPADDEAADVAGSAPVATRPDEQPLVPEAVFEADDRAIDATIKCCARGRPPVEQDLP